MIPLQSATDFSRQEDYFMWALVNMDGMSGAPLVLPEVVLRSWSKHLYECGFRHHPDLQEIYYRPPAENASVLEAGAGEWVKADKPGVPPDFSDESQEDLLVDVMKTLPPGKLDELVRKAGEQRGEPNT